MSQTLRTLLVWIAFAVFLIVLPMFFTSRTSITVMNVMGIWVVFALAYNMLLGQAGMLSFGHAVYFGLGGYAAIHLIVAIKAQKLGIPVFAVPIVGFMAGMVAGAVIGWFSCRRSGTPFAMISLGVGELVAAAGFMFVSLFGGEEGISGDRSSGLKVFGFSLGPQINVFYFIAFWMFISTLAMWAFTRTPLGRLANAVRDNPDRVAFIGYDPQRVRYLVFLISGGFAGLAGALSAVNFEIINPETLGAHGSGLVLLMTFIGGAGVFFGPILGAAIITFMQSMLSDYTQVWQLYLGLLFVVMVLFAPFGIGGIIARIIHAGAKGEIGEKLPAWLLGTVGGLIAFFGAVMSIEMAYRVREAGKPFRALGVDFVHTNPMNWLAAFVIMAGGIALITIAVRWRRRGSLGAAMRLREVTP
ncbi:leucine/isoleucine/valine transporter permease subunit [Variibacter gotjawalensis]|uniref:Leucine/isoleucine/valine transporter permease subunit n=1 Tax=Variibacter gotjawalensis TaxID=1333996 RepID=A0A0S3PW69_9BRAD|nr:branched-chain amino acid ABC transporter permease [Variibacter gotjawalensis]NIK46015.1 branched-chain amino acid transport system permease protein [Variibacter gotjawalensis]RZS47933.1 amino acid/amide ABC transporter membrane protein 2 (HAAT family) [Variibacter gotjawalensis]BAT60189.1 leucine/isoleucine/valine transporter permease subunit [Variibacter gotjawalensis]